MRDLMKEMLGSAVTCDLTQTILQSAVNITCDLRKEIPKSVVIGELTQKIPQLVVTARQNQLKIMSAVTIDRNSCKQLLMACTY